MLTVGKSKQLVGEGTIPVKVDLHSPFSCEGSSVQLFEEHSLHFGVIYLSPYIA